MKQAFSVAAMVLLSLLLLVQVGCNEDDGGGTTDTGACSIRLTRPVDGETYLTSETTRPVKILWERTGPNALVDIDLYKGHQFVGPIAAGEENDGYYFWFPSTMGENSSDDYSVMVTAADESACADESGVFGITNTQGCAYTFTTEMPIDNTIYAGEPLHLTWDSVNTTGSVDIHLYSDGALSDVLMGYVATAVPDTGGYLWDVDSLHKGTGNFYLVMQDHELERACQTTSAPFVMIDEDICQIVLLNPQPDVEWTEGEVRTIDFEPNNTSSTVEIRLYTGTTFLGTIATGVSAAAGTYTWTVDNFNNDDGSATLYRVRIYDEADSYCFGISELFSITPN